MGEIFTNSYLHSYEMLQINIHVIMNW